MFKSKDKNPYTIRVETIDGIPHYYVSFKDGQAVQRETEVSHPVYLEFQRFERLDENMRRSDTRHLERSELTDETLYVRAFYPPKGVEETVIDGIQDKCLREAIAEMSEVQRRRFILYREFGLTYGQIAQMEGCERQPVTRSIERAEEKIREAIKKFRT